MFSSHGSFDDQQNINIPDSFRCPITTEIMENPVICADGHSYEREAITAWLRAHNTSPLTNEILPHKNLINNINLKKAIQDLLERQPVLRQENRDFQMAVEIRIKELESVLEKRSKVNRTYEEKDQIIEDFKIGFQSRTTFFQNSPHKIFPSAPPEEGKVNKVNEYLEKQEDISNNFDIESVSLIDEQIDVDLSSERQRLTNQIRLKENELALAQNMLNSHEISNMLTCLVIGAILIGLKFGQVINSNKANIAIEVLGFFYLISFFWSVLMKVFGLELFSPAIWAAIIVLECFEQDSSAPASIQREIDNLQQQLDALELQENDSTQERLELGIQNRF